MSEQRGSSLVIGIGNVLLRDDGVGVHVVREIARLAAEGEIELPAGTQVIDGGTLGLDLLPLLSSARRTVLVDAADLGRAPGAVGVICGESLREALVFGGPAHRVGIGDLLGAARLMGTSLESVAIVGIQPAEIGAGLELSEAVWAAVPAAVEMTLNELRRPEAVEPSPGAGSSSLARDCDTAGVAA